MYSIRAYARLMYLYNIGSTLGQWKREMRVIKQAAQCSTLQHYVIIKLGHALKVHSIVSTTQNTPHVRTVAPPNTQPATSPLYRAKVPLPRLAVHVARRVVVHVAPRAPGVRSLEDSRLRALALDLAAHRLPHADLDLPTRVSAGPSSTQRTGGQLTVPSECAGGPTRLCVVSALPLRRRVCGTTRTGDLGRAAARNMTGSEYSRWFELDEDCERARRVYREFRLAEGETADDTQEGRRRTWP